MAWHEERVLNWEARVFMSKTELQVRGGKPCSRESRGLLCFAHLKLRWRQHKAGRQGNGETAVKSWEKRGQVQVEFLITTAALSFPGVIAKTVFVYGSLKIKKKLWTEGGRLQVPEKWKCLGFSCKSWNACQTSLPRGYFLPCSAVLLGNVLPKHPY